MTLLLVLVGFLFFAGVAMTVNEGLWSNTVSLLCVMISGIAGALAGVPIGVMIIEQGDFDEQYAWHCIFVGVWGVFVVSLLIVRIITDRISSVRVRFLPVIDKIGGILMGLFVAVMLASFAAFTLLYIPVKAGEWKLSDASEAQRGYFQQFASPFYSVLVPFTSAEDVDAAFYGR